MKTMRLMLTFTVILMGCCSANAQKVYKVYLGHTNKEGNEVIDALKAKIGSSGRYALTETVTALELELDIVCFEQSPSVKGFTCASNTTLFSSAVDPLFTQIGTLYLAQSGDADKVAEKLFEHFVADTNDEEISVCVKQLKENVALFCRNATHKPYCQK
jgi:hypothetical protein